MGLGDRLAAGWTNVAGTWVVTAGWMLLSLLLISGSYAKVASAVKGSTS